MGRLAAPPIMQEDCSLNSIAEITVSSVSDLLNHCTPQAPDPASGKLRNRFVYRGLDDEAYPLLSSLSRQGGTSPPHTKCDLEYHILRNFVRYSLPYLPSRPVRDWEYVVIAQHHGLPTRILDWSYSPLVAAHFATFKGSPSTDRVIWRLDWPTVHDHFGIRQISVLDLQAVLKQFGAPVFWDYLESLRISRQFVCLLEPPSLDARIVAQSAAFTFSTWRDEALEDTLVSNGLAAAIQRLVIPSTDVSLIRDQLDLCSVDERRLFPDLDGVAAEMKRYYS